jgi:3-hydroxyacyl-CoA dehydrogenase
MGARIAAHLANAGIPCYLLDIVPPELSADEKRKGLTLDKPAVRNRIVLAGLDAAKKSRPAAFFTPETARLISPGNFEDNLAWCGEVDWIIEAVAENLEIKRKLFERVEAIRKPGTIVTTNTSGLPIRLIAEGRSEDFQQHWAGTHFFNPPRYMKLAELIPGPKTLPDVMEALDEICDLRLGKGVVIAKDTPNFIANRVGTFSLLNAIQQMLALDMTFEEVDACSGSAVGWPRSATFRTADIVGLDVLDHVIRNIYDSIPADESREMFRVPPLVQEMMKRGWLGEKTGGGFYKRVKGDGVSPAAEGEIRLDRSRQGDRRYAPAPPNARWPGDGRPRRRQGQPIYLVRAGRDLPLRRTARAGNREYHRGCGSRDALGIRMGARTI